MFTYMITSYQQFFILFLYTFYQQNLLTSRTKLISFVFHEVRTPLMTATLGVDLLYEELEKLKKLRENKENEQSVSDIYTDTKSSCIHAIEVLNDILTINKLENGLFTAEFELISSKVLFDANIQPFHINVRFFINYFSMIVTLYMYLLTR